MNGSSALFWNGSTDYHNDKSSMSFSFTMKNPHGTPLQKFVLIVVAFLMVKMKLLFSNKTIVFPH
jgi:hypothetical protein